MITNGFLEPLLSAALMKSRSSRAVHVFHTDPPSSGRLQTNIVARYAFRKLLEATDRRVAVCKYLADRFELLFDIGKVDVVYRG